MVMMTFMGNRQKLLTCEHLHFLACSPPPRPKKRKWDRISVTGLISRACERALNWCCCLSYWILWTNLKWLNWHLRYCVLTGYCVGWRMDLPNAKFDASATAQFMAITGARLGTSGGCSRAVSASTPTLHTKICASVRKTLRFTSIHAHLQMKSVLKVSEKCLRKVIGFQSQGRSLHLHALYVPVADPGYLDRVNTSAPSHLRCSHSHTHLAHLGWEPHKDLTGWATNGISCSQSQSA